MQARGFWTLALLSKRELLKYLARRYPRPDVASTIRRLPPQPGAASAGPTGSIEPLSPSSYRLQLNTSEALKEKLELARDLMSHANPSGDLAVVVERALDLLLEKLKGRRFGETKRPRRAPDSAPSPVKVQQQTPTHATPSPARPKASRSTRLAGRPHITHESRRAVLARDGLRCCYASDDGRRCTARAFLQFDHEQPWAKGGTNRSNNLRVLCHAHNQLLAELAYGRAKIEAAIQARSSTEHDPEVNR